jgi:hypothetical protein
MISLEFDTERIYANFGNYRQWKTTATDATARLIAWIQQNPQPKKGQSLPVEREVYGALKAYLKEYFRGKCAYCESYFEHVAWGDVEHYRPKRAVKEEPGHRGYYWLAYAEENLLPSCALCNQGSGKGNHFPIAGARVWQPGGPVDSEEPCLLNPYHREDGWDFMQARILGERSFRPRHLWYKFLERDGQLIATGIAEYHSVKGECSIRTYDLNRQSLVRRRCESQSRAIDSLELAFNGNRSLETVLRRLMADTHEHASAVRAACHEYLAFRQRKIHASVAAALADTTAEV